MMPRNRRSAALLVALLAGALPAMDLGLPERYRLRNGLRVVVLRDGSLPLIGLAVAAPAGARVEAKGTRGYGHLLANLWQDLAWSKQSAALKTHLEDAGAFVGASHRLNAVLGMGSFPAEDWKTALAVADAWLGLRRAPDAHVGQAAGRALRVLAEKPKFPLTRGLVDDRLRQVVYGDHALGNPMDGVAEDLRSATPARLEEYLERVLVPNEATVVLVGDVPTEDELLEDLLERFTRPAGTGLDRDTPPPPAEGRQVHEAADVERAVAVVGYRIPGVDHDDYPALYLIRNLLGAGPGSLLYDELVERKGLVASLDPDISTLRDDNILSFQLQGRGDRVMEAVAAALRIAARTGKRSPDPELLLDVRRGLKAARALKQQDRTSKAALLARAELLGEIDILEDVPYRLDQVTPDDVRRVAARYLAPARAFVVELHPRAAAEVAQEATVRVQYDGGLELIARRDRTSEVVGLALSFPAGDALEGAGEPGLASLLESYLAATGSRRISPPELRRRLRRNATQVRPLGGGQWWGVLGMTATTYGFEELLEVLHGVATEPRWEADVLARVRVEVREAWQRAVDDPQDAAYWDLYRDMYPGSPSRLDPKLVAERLDGYTLDDLKAAHAKLVAAGRWSVGVSGDVDPARVAEIVGRVFGAAALPKGAPPKPFPVAPSTGETGILVKTLTSAEDYDTVWAGIALPGEAMEAVGPLTVWLNLVGLRGDSLLQEALRKIDPGVEVLHKSIQLPPAGGAMAFGFRVAAGKGTAARKRVKEILANIEGHRITEEQVRQTSRRIRTALLLQSQNNLLQAARLAGDGLVIGRPDLDRHLLEAYAKMTVGDVRDAGKLLRRRAVRAYLSGRR